jgi:hypothetical protein
MVHIKPVRQLCARDRRANRGHNIVDSRNEEVRVSCVGTQDEAASQSRQRPNRTLGDRRVRDVGEVGGPGPSAERSFNAVRHELHAAPCQPKSSPDRNPVTELIRSPRADNGFVRSEIWLHINMMPVPRAGAAVTRRRPAIARESATTIVQEREGRRLSTTRRKTWTRVFGLESDS